jgi:DNA-binding protein HU-beta
MNKTDLVEVMVSNTDFTKKQAKEAIEEFVTAVTNSLKLGEKVSIPGLGTFSVVQRSARVGRNPQTGATLNIPAKNVVKFSPAADLKTNI